jgi:hypothetical protein
MWDVIYIYIYETTTYCSDIQAFIVVICYTDGDSTMLLPVISTIHS